MTIEGPQEEQASSTELTSSMASTAAELWNEVLQRLDEVQSVAPSSASAWMRSEKPTRSSSRPSTILALFCRPPS